MWNFPIILWILFFVSYIFRLNIILIIRISTHFFWRVHQKFLSVMKQFCSPRLIFWEIYCNFLGCKKWKKFISSSCIMFDRYIEKDNYESLYCFLLPCLANCKTFRFVKVQLYLILQTPNYCFEVRVPLPASNSWRHILFNALLTNCHFNSILSIYSHQI